MRLSLPILYDEVKKKRPKAQIQRETDQVVYTMTIEGRDFATFLRILPEGSMLQILTFFPYSLQRANTGDVARLLHLLNKQLDMPGFGMDELSSVIFYRLMLPAQERKIDARLIHTYLAATDNVCEIFGQPIGVVSSGSLSFDEVIQQISQLQPTPVHP